MKRLVTSAILCSALFATNYHYGYKNFSLIKEYNIFGNTETIGNTVECVTNLKRVRDIHELNFAQCSNDLSKYNNKYMTKYINVLGANFLNSSTANLKFPATFKKIVWAAVVWQGHVNNYSYQASYTHKTNNEGYDKYYYNFKKVHNSKDKYRFIKTYEHNHQPLYKLSNDLPNNETRDIKEIGANEISLIIPNSSPIKIEADELYYSSDYRKFQGKIKRGVKYSAYKVLPQEVIDKLNNLAVPNGEIPITIANIKSTIGLDRKLGDYGAWTLVVVYEEDKNNPNSKFRNNSIYYGFQSIYGRKKVSINIKDLILPVSGKINSTLSVFTAEGEYSNKGDTVTINNELPKEILEGFDPKNVFDSRLSLNISREPFLINNNGIDIDVFDIGEILEKTRNKSKKAKNDVNIKIVSPKDGVFISTLAFSTELYQPRICYYIDTIRDENGELVYDNRHFLRAINPNQKYQISLWIANMNNNSAVERAENVKIFDKFYNFDYVNNSFELKNVGERSFLPVSDKKDEDLGEFVNNQFNLRIGKGAYKDKGGILPPYLSDEDKVYLKFKGQFKVDNTDYINLDDFISLYTSFKTPYVSIDEENAIPLPKCIDFNTRARVFIPPAGSFNVIHSNQNIAKDPLDVNNSINALFTQIVNKDFNVSVVKLADDNQTLQNYTGYVEVDLIPAPRNENECKSLPSIIPPKYVKFNNEAKKDITLKVDKAYKDLRFRVRYLDSSAGCLYNTMNAIMNGNFSPMSMMSCAMCANECKQGINSCFKCIFGSTHSKVVCSRDDFAIRPDKFKISLPKVAKAGDEINATIEALDYNGNVVSNYNEVLSLDRSVSPHISSADVNPLAIDANLTFAKNSNVGFSKGIAKVSLIYPEVGNIEINVSEVNGSEFAYVDAKDTPNRFIKQASSNVELIPYSFNVRSSLKNGGDSNFTYISNDLNMSANLNINIQALNKQGEVTKNYSANLYSKDTNATIYHSSLDNMISNVVFLNPTFTSKVLAISSDEFKNGIYQKDIKININRKYNDPIAPKVLTVNSLKVSNKDLTTNVNIDESVKFLYGRIKVEDVSTYSNEANTTAKFLYFGDDNNWHVNTAHDITYGDINKSKSIYPKNVEITQNPINNGVELLNISTTHSLPYTAKIHYSIPSYLWYHALAKTYKDPSSTNLDCLTHPCSVVEFKSSKKGWGGVGKSGIKYSETNRTSELNSTQNATKANKKEVFKIDW